MGRGGEVSCNAHMKQARRDLHREGRIPSTADA